MPSSSRLKETRLKRRQSSRQSGYNGSSSTDSSSSGQSGWTRTATFAVDKDTGNDMEPRWQYATTMKETGPSQSDRPRGRTKPTLVKRTTPPFQTALSCPATNPKKGQYDNVTPTGMTPSTPRPTLPPSYNAPRFTGGRMYDTATSYSFRRGGREEEEEEERRRNRMAVVGSLVIFFLIFIIMAWAYANPRSYTWGYSKMKAAETVLRGPGPGGGGGGGGIPPALVNYDPYARERERSFPIGMAVIGILAATVVGTLTLLFWHRSKMVVAQSTASFFFWVFAVVGGLLTMTWGYFLVWQSPPEPTGAMSRWSSATRFCVYVGAVVVSLLLMLFCCGMLAGRRKKKRGKQKHGDNKNRNGVF